MKDASTDLLKAQGDKLILWGVTYIYIKYIKILEDNIRKTLLEISLVKERRREQIFFFFFQGKKT